MQRAGRFCQLHHTYAKNARRWFTKRPLIVSSRRVRWTGKWVWLRRGWRAWRCRHFPGGDLAVSVLVCGWFIGRWVFSLDSTGLVLSCPWESWPGKEEAERGFHILCFSVVVFCVILMPFVWCASIARLRSFFARAPPEAVVRVRVCVCVFVFLGVPPACV